MIKEFNKQQLEQIIVAVISQITQNPIKNSARIFPLHLSKEP